MSDATNKRHTGQACIELRETLNRTQHGKDLEQCDFVLVSKNLEAEPDCEALRKQVAFIEELTKKDFDIKTHVYKKKRFYGIVAPEAIFSKYKYLLKVSDSCNWSREPHEKVPEPTRIAIVNFILHRICIGNGEGFRELLQQKVFETAFSLHEEEEQRELKQKWARWTACLTWQPITEVRNYFGEKVALYFLWLGWYTFTLIPAAIVGIVVFLYGLAFFDSNPLIKEVCEADIIMCPLCDKKCGVWNLSETCTYAKVTHLFDNEGTVFFAMFMAVWATVFLELWKRHRASYVCAWKVFNWCENEEELILELVNNPNCKPTPYSHSYLRSTLVLVLVTLMLVLIIGLAIGLVVFRVVATVVLSEGQWELLSEHASTVAVMLGAVMHYLTMTIMTKVNRRVALYLCSLEKTRSFAATEKSFTVKMFTFQFFTLFSSLIYVAFFLGRINGRPGGYVRITGKWRLEECHPSGCITDLFIQMAIIMVLKQTLNNVFEFSAPWLSTWLKKKRKPRKKRSCSPCGRSTEWDACDDHEPPCDPELDTWLTNYNLNEVNAFSLFEEFLEMVMQFSFTTIFVAAFPLAPLLALINNVLEIRLDAIKMVSLERRLVPKKTNNIGVWINVLEWIGVLAVIANGLVIGITSDFIPRMVYRYRYGPCVGRDATGLDCMTGYINNSLSTVRVSDENIRRDFQPNQLVFKDINVTHCSYRDYRNNEDYSYTSQFWLILAVRFAFVILFEHVIVICKFIVAWFVPDIPQVVKNDRLQDKLHRLQKELRNMEQRSSDV
ncbi:anoctamin-9 isoform X2 [Amia ocellicauda]|uniref:anoctamin-9 isoform X2 n=1 Tax=Amia ocellicauda TaxID=2972642 RepID=UPI0034649BD3